MKYSWSKNQFSLRTSLIVPLVIQVVITVTLVGYLAFINGREAINDIVQQLRAEIAERVTIKLQEFTHAPFLLNQMNTHLLDGVKFPLNQADGKSLSHKLWQHLPSFPTIAYSYFAESSSGHFYGASRIHDAKLTTIISNYNKNQEYIIYHTQPNGQLDTALRTVSNYEPRERHWYKTALERKTVAWSQVYVGFSTRSLMLTAVQPLFSPAGQLLGVFGADVTLNQISEFLSTLKIGQHGQSFIIDREGFLIANSSKLPAFDAQNQRIAASQFSEPTIHATANFLNQQLDLKKLTQQSYLSFQLNHETQFVQVMPFQDAHGLDWLFVTTVPENDFIQQIRNNTQLTILLCIVAVIISAGMGLLTTHFINTPIRKLGDAARAIAEGDMEQQLLITSRIVELELLINYFNEMKKQLKISFCVLEARNAELRHARDDLAATFSQLEAVLNAMPGAIFWVDVNGHYMGVNRFFATLCRLSPEEFIGQPLDFVHQSPIFVNFAHQFLASEQETVTEELPIHLIHHREHYCLVVAQKYQSNQMIVFVSIDMSKRKQAEEERQHFVEKLAHLNRAYERFVPREFLRCLNKQSVEEIELGDQVERKMTILFADIRNFTTISEQLSPQENFDFLNDYLREISPVIREHHGFIDKYIGDAIVALFPNSADDAVLAALGMLQRLKEFNQQQVAKWSPVCIGIGINTGMLMLGTIGETNRMDSTVISDAVNLASRLENLTKQYGVELLISEYTYQNLHNPHVYRIQLIDSEVKVKGRNEPLAIYEVLSII